MSQPFEYDKILYNEVVWYLSQKWGRKLTDHEINVLIEGYKFGRLVEAQNEIKIVEVVQPKKKVRTVKPL
jgi:hypothetical protein